MRFKKEYKSLVEKLKPEALKIVEKSHIPIGVTDVAKKLDVSWTTARQILTELVAEGKIQTLKTAKSRVYFPTGAVLGKSHEKPLGHPKR